MLKCVGLFLIDASMIASGLKTISHIVTYCTCLKTWYSCLLNLVALQLIRWVENEVIIEHRKILK